jgi:hypothetical protein
MSGADSHVADDLMGALRGVRLSMQMNMSPKPVEPQLGAASFTCPHCGAVAHQTWYRLFLVNHERGDKPGFYDYGEIVSRIDLKKI